MTTLVTITSKNQITIPASVVSVLGFSQTRKLAAKIVGDTLVLKKTGPNLRDLQGSLSRLPQAKEYSVLKAIEIARKMNANKLGEEFEKMHEI